MDWLAALAAITAAGARVGRVLVRTANTARVMIIAAVCFTALAQTASISDVSRVFGGRGPSDVVIGWGWAGFATTSAVIALHAWPGNSVRRRRWGTAVVLVLGISAAAASITHPAVGWAAVLALLVFVLATGIRVLDKTPLGQAVALYCAGMCAPIIVAAEILAGREPNMGLLTAGALTISLATVWTILGSWVRARLLLHRISQLHDTLVTRFPEIRGDSWSRTPTVLRAADHVSEIMDALYVQTGAGLFDDGIAPPSDPNERARRIADTVRDPLAHPVLGNHWIAPPDEMSIAQWVSLIAGFAREGSR